MRAVLTLFAVLASACGLLPPNDPGPAVPEPQRVTDCMPPFAFEGDTTLAAIGIGDLDGIGQEATRRGSIRITRDTVRWEQFAPPDVPPGPIPEGQMLCVTWPDGSGLNALLPEQFDGPERDADPASAAADDLPVVPILVFVAVVLVIGISWLAFRRETG
jgi:hypothetical protein